jgi:hypothetical protein
VWIGWMITKYLKDLYNKADTKVLDPSLMSLNSSFLSNFNHFRIKNQVV